MALHAKAKIGDDDLWTFEQLLRKWYPNTEIKPDRVRELACNDWLREVADPAAEFNREWLRAALKLNKVIRSRAELEVTIDYTLSNRQMLTDMKRTVALPLVFAAHHKWYCNDDEVLAWADNLPRKGSGNGMHKLVTLDFASETGGERMIIEMRDARMDFADFPHFMGFLKRCGRKKQGRQIFIARADSAVPGQWINGALVYSQGDKTHELSVVGSHSYCWSAARLLAVPGVLQ